MERLLHLGRHWGPLLLVPRLIAASARRVAWAVSTLFWRMSLAQLGRRSVIQSAVYFSHPKTVSVGRHCMITAGVVVSSEMLSGYLELADGVQINRKVRLDCSGGLVVKRGTLISEEVMIFTHTHGYDPRTEPSGTPLVVEEGVWIGARSMIMAGVGMIGTGSIVAAGAVVTKPVPPKCVVAGNPARVVRTLSES